MSESTQSLSFSEDDELIFADEDEELIFAEEDVEDENKSEASWKILIVDDEVEIHNVTKLALNDFTYEGKSVDFISAYSGEEAKNLLPDHPDIAIILLDVVMETEDAGLEVVKYIREFLNNQLLRIILRTGQPGQVPENVVIINYDINDYKTKTELTTQKLFTTVLTALRSYRTLITLEASKTELEKIAAASARFVPREFLRFLQRESIVDAKLGDSVQAEMTIMFADIRSFTSLSERMSPRENFNFLNSYLSRVGPVIRQHKGFIDKYIGDGVMALFPETPEDALLAAIEMQKQVCIYNKHRKNSGYPPLSIGIGLHTGSLMLGTIGEQERMESTVVSDAVNLASRIEGLTKLYGASIIISEQTLFEINDHSKYNHRFLDKVQVKGKKDFVSIFEIFDSDMPEIKELKNHTLMLFQSGVSLYLEKQWQAARYIFQDILQFNPQDRAAMLYIKRCERFQKYGTTELLDGLEI